jgi:CRP/FNR family transcriptional regulator, cyclic AMP receptor protein
MTTVHIERAQQNCSNLGSKATMRRYRKGEVVAHAGDPADSLIMVVSGRLASRYQTLHGDQTLAGVSGPGTFVAAYAVLGTVKRHPATIVAMEDTLVRLVRFEEFESLTREHPEILRVLLTSLADESARFGGQLNVAYWEKAEVRVRRNVCELAEMAWRNGPGPVSVSLTHDDVAAMAGVSRPTASTTIRSAVDAGVFRWGRGKLIVDELSRVRAWAS